MHKDELTVAGEIDSVQKAVKMIKDIFEEKDKTSKTVSVEVRFTVRNIPETDLFYLTEVAICKSFKVFSCRMGKNDHACIVFNSN